MSDFAEQLREFTGELAITARLWRKLAREMVARHGIAEAGASPLLWINRLGGNVRQNVLAEYCGIEGPSLVRLIDDLQGAGLVVRVPDPSDRRANLLSLTEDGQRKLTGIEAELQQLRAMTFAELTPQEIATASKVLAVIRAAARGEE
ncbi:MarR family winged helix-turn-helix transcriptional regulator [Devosia sp.]|uniref:MarR family winged helix-turn-helix transcriptional regulator n=1 Tax=Devosia sp. TaxID=1871048 RepID=UPI003267C9CD